MHIHLCLPPKRKVSARDFTMKVHHHARNPNNIKGFRLPVKVVKAKLTFLLEFNYLCVMWRIAPTKEVTILQTYHNPKEVLFSTGGTTLSWSLM